MDTTPLPLDDKTETTWIHLGEAPLDLAAADAFLRTERAGGIDLFLGTTRRWTDGRETVRLAYEQEIRASVGATLDDLYESIDLVARGVVRPVIDHTLPLEDYQQGLDQMASGEVIGKVVLTPSGDAA